MSYDSVRFLFSDPGHSLLRNPFGDLACYFLGVFYPCNPSQALISLQTDVLTNMGRERSALLFEANHVEAVEKINGDISNIINQRILETDQLCDLNLYFEKTASGVCISQEESLVFCASLNPEKKAYLNAIVKKFSSEILESVEPIKKHVKLLSGAIPRYYL